MSKVPKDLADDWGISLPIHYPEAKDRYQKQKFFGYVLNALAGWCPLCQGAHPPKFHAFAPRRYRIDGSEPGEKAQIEVPRVICLRNRRRRAKTGEPLQYTLTILPGFLIPHSTVPVDAVHGALRSYLGPEQLTQLGATLRMGCLNPLSFQLFYRRVQQRIAEWILAVMHLVLALGSAPPQQSQPNASSELRLQWGRFETLGEEHLRLYSRIPGTTVMNRQQGWRYLYALLSRRRLGLGP